MNSLVTHKQLVINSIALPIDLINAIKDFLFYDRLSAESRHKKRGLINQFKLGLWYEPGFKDGHWALAFRYEAQLQAINCVCCGQYQIGGQALVCNCDENYVEEIMEQISGKMDIHADENWNGYMVTRFDNYELEMYD